MVHSENKSQELFEINGEITGFMQMESPFHSI